MMQPSLSPLRLVFWGCLLCAFELTILEGDPSRMVSFRFDVLNDFVGMLLVTIGVSNLANQLQHPRFRKTMTFVWGCCVLNVAEAFASHFVQHNTAALQLVSESLALASLVAILSFLSSVRQLALENHQPKVALSWQMTRMLATVFWVIPLGMLHISNLASLASVQPFQWKLGTLAFVFSVTLLIPLVHFLWSILRTTECTENQTPNSETATPVACPA